ncbi:2a4a47cc-7ef8-487d-a6ed-046b2f22a85c [Sclerotinia trifoliorum]|uniref:2a4a47cc-7ef8-487d-a6ed-046b2f22a85c n=1 Tax=Sclerotinia trifoliorum TaxID=28548 RepID=A0A8H2ZN97_9HELO|nr:2a4a47cc-7ef8-487d-a6ed-046b2f22a85c [Sclerotinia trifoliorum]
MEEENYRNNLMKDAENFQLTGDIEDLFASGPKCPVDYVEPQVAKRRKFNSDSTKSSSPSPKNTREAVSPISESLSVFSQQAMPNQKTAEPNSSSNTTPRVTSQMAQHPTGQESLLSQESPSGLNNSSNNDLPITSFNGQDTDLQTIPIISQVSSPDIHLSQSSTNAITTPEIFQTPSGTHLIFIPEPHQIVQQQPCGVTGVPLGPTISQSPEMQVESNVYGHQLSPQRSHNQPRPFTEFLAEQNLGFTPLRRSLKQQPTSLPQSSVQASQKPTEHATRLCLPTPPTPNTDLQQSSPPVLDRSSIKPQLREVMERFENKIRMDAELRQAFNIVFPARSIEVEELKQKMLNERRQAALKENALRKIITEYQDNITAQEALQTRAMGLLTQLRTDPKHDRSWVCLNYNKNGQLCNHIQKEFYLLAKVWRRRERCSKCKTKTHELSRKYLDDDAAISSWNFEKDGPAMPENTQSLKRTRDMTDKPAVTPLLFVDSNRRQSLPSLTVAGKDLQQDSSSRWASLPPPTQKKARNHLPLNNNKETRDTLRAALGAPSKTWMQAPKQIETIVLDDDNEEEVETDQSEESPNDTPAVEAETRYEDSMEADFDAAFNADLEAELEADLTAAFEEELV